MQSLFFLFALFTALANQVLAFEIAVGNKVFKTTELFAIPESPVKTACAANCTDATTKIAACNDDTPCLCRAETFNAMLSCETCMFNYLIAKNKPMPDPRAGSNVVVGGYVAVCKGVNPALMTGQTALKVPAGWDGPLVSILPIGGAIVTVLFAGILGVSAILLLSNM
ncbi:hypothetical protein D9611_000904 [Ephemerocybe angulata]|uniref:Uncharacterized protein n=1 Tax=Ephemerocybe angulata TaxID=980116 RepID=A0A8H5BP89_9AGAR|nr:hypothetical protein D9611_000904 [Tulosesus angulatus]